MHCAKCGAIDTSVIDSRETENGAAIRRRRSCDKCGYRFTTYERIDAASFVVVKKNGTRESFAREKLEKSLWVACQKRPIRRDQIDTILTKIEEELRGEKEVDSRKIGQLVMKYLKMLDDVAYIRYASVYREFKDVASFQKEVRMLRK
ncbi:MAG: transcriptional regulator NrdR [Candidatus Gracilibacteria bacterium]|jgi:transcriptional repressor NrdR|nr:transcriptional regulator NrdR [Candidatus Gracilibacteria bacterium]MDD5178718.1 transcriptional regulator NrdR [Candidatus Gracilibacteria bacterium]